MTLRRRTLWQFAGASGALSVLWPATLAAGPNNQAGAASGFNGDGLYLYPAWGRPRLYEVRRCGGYLEFRNPGASQLLWTQSPDLDPSLSGPL
jgi:hypothetical protein